MTVILALWCESEFDVWFWEGEEAQIIVNVYGHKYN